MVEVAPNWALYKYKTLDVGGNEEYKKCFGAACSVLDLFVGDGEPYCTSRAEGFRRWSR